MRRFINIIDGSIPKPLLSENFESMDEKLNKFLIREINKRLSLYVCDLNKNVYESTQLNTDNIKNISNIEYSDIENISINRGIVEYTINSFTRIKKERRIWFIWFLDDFNGKFRLSNDIYINPKAGQLIIFPASWVFRLDIENNKNECVKVLYGYTYLLNEEV